MARISFFRKELTPLPSSCFIVWSSPPQGAINSQLGHTEISLRMANDELEDLRKHLGAKLNELKDMNAKYNEALNSQ